MPLNATLVKILDVNNNNRVQQSFILGAITALFLILGLGYSTLTPIFENSDETLHYPYIKYLADGNGLPLAIPDQLWNQEGTQPPLYYALVAAATFWLDTNNLANFLQKNPHWRFTDVRFLINDNQNLVLHGPIDQFPYQQAALAIHIGRWISLFFGLVTVICTFFIAQQLFPNSLFLAISAMVITAFTPQFIRVSATVSNDSLSAALAAFTVLLALKFTQAPAAPLPPNQPVSPPTSFNKQRSIFYPLVLGLLSALALMTKFSSLSVFFLAALIIFWRNFFITELHQKSLQKMVRWLLIMAGVMLLLTGWWFWRNYQLYGEWLATETHLNLAGRGQLNLTQIWRLRAEIERAYWATFGWGQIRLPEWMYQTLGWFSRLGLLFLGAATITKLIQGNRSKPIPLNVKHINFEAIIFLLIWVGLNIALYLRWITEVGSVSHTRLIFPAITAISLLLAIGWHTLLPNRWYYWLTAIIAISFFSLNVYALTQLITPAFRPNTKTETVNLRSTLNLTFLHSLTLQQGGVQTDTAPATGGDPIFINVRWQTVAPMDKNYSVAAALLAPDGTVLAQRESYPGLGLRPTRYLLPGDSFVDRYPLALTSPISQPMVAKAVVNLFDFDSKTRAGFPALNVAGVEITPLVGRLKIVPQPWPKYQPHNVTSTNFANSIKLIGYDLSEDTIILYWKSITPVNEDYNLFIHLVDAEGNIIIQADAPASNGIYPTSWWEAGEIIATPHPLPKAPAATTVRFGLYSLTSGQRLPIHQSDLPHQDNSVEITLP